MPKVALYFALDMQCVANLCSKANKIYIRQCIFSRFS